MIHLDDLLAATGGRLHGPARATAFDAFCYDSRLIQPGQLFLAVKTDRADGHDYIEHACQGGATGVLCQDPAAAAACGATCVVVPDTRQAIQDWARYILAKQGLQIIGVTGSVGKTTTKEAIAAVLSAAETMPGTTEHATASQVKIWAARAGIEALAGFSRPRAQPAKASSPENHPNISIFKNQANFNGLYGLPIALGELRPEQRIAVLEMAADHFGEMARLCQIAPPHIAVVTTVEPAHLETFGSLEAIAREKGDLVAALPAAGLAVLNADDPRVLAMAERTTARVVTFGISRLGRSPIECPVFPGTEPGYPDVCATGIIVTRDGVRFDVATPAGRTHVHFPLLGRHQVYAALAAIAVGLAHDIPLETLAERLAALPRLPGRLNPLPGRRGSLLLDDSYSASPAAVEAALETLAAVEGRRKIAVLGDMLELGEYEAAGHEQVGKRAAGVLDLLVTKGNRARRIAEAARTAGMAADQVVVTYTAEDAARAVLDRLGPGDVVLVKGSLATRMEQVVRPLMADPALAAELLVRQDAAWLQIVTVRPDRPTWLEIDLGAIGHNVRRLKELAGASHLLISLKADAYGHGAVQVAQTALLNGATWLGVACFSEGVALRQAGIAAPILILGYTPAWQARDAVRYDLTATVFDLDDAAALSRAALALERPAAVHVKVDTGMGRLGIFPAEALDFIRTLRGLPGLTVEGLFTHLSVADGTSEWEEAYTAGQLAAFDRLLAELAAAGIEIPLVHAANSAALLQSAFILPPSSFRLHHSSFILHPSLVRPGIAVYGLDPSPQVRCPADFRPALAWKTQIAQVKELPAGSYVGYGATYRTPGPERIAVIPVGYADGFRRGPQHWGQVLVRGRRAAIVGRVCMDQTMINVTGIPGVRQGDEVVLIGRQGDDRITVEEVATRLGTINYEVVSAILARVPREAVA